LIYHRGEINLRRVGMAVKSTGTEPSTGSKAAPAAKSDDQAADTTPDPRGKVESTCVVRADFHVGNAIPGTKVCSYHTMHYAADGSRRQ
jgi:hypothetical protein